MSSITITTYNVLAQAYIKPDRYPNVDPRHLEPAPRAALLRDTVHALDSDVFLFQEVDDWAQTALAEALPDHTPFSTREPDRPAGCGVWVRRPHKLVLRWLTPAWHNVLAIYDMNGLRFGVASAHLRWMPDETPVADHLGAQQLRELIDETLEHDVPWILGGDFNATSQSCVLDVARAAGFALGGASLRPWDTTNIGRRCRKIDYLLYDPKTLSSDPVPMAAITRETPMPSAIHASDHLPFTCAFRRL